MKTITLREVAHSRAGEKGDDVNISVIAHDEQDYQILVDQVTAEAVGELYGPIVQGAVERYEVPNVGALNFMLYGALGGGRSRTLAFDESGKALSPLILSLPISVPDDYTISST